MWRDVEGIKIAVDRLFEIYVNGRPAATLVASPVDLDDLALGFLYAEGYIDSPEDVVEIAVRGNAIYAGIRRPAGSFRQLEECGGAVAEARRKLVEVSLSMDEVRALASEFGKLTMPSVEPSLAMHTTALLNGEWLVAHDVSRHSSVLKLVGKAVRKGARGGVVFTTGRASSDIVARSAAVGASVVVSIRGPLYSGVEAACRLGVTLVANVRGRGFAVLCDRGRIKAGL
ncbi:MAG: formate dehydrogenase accessory sulfurtransferase FdhD [Thermoproteus sp.]